MKVRSYDALTDYDKVMDLCKQEKLTELYRKDKTLFKEALSNSESFVCVDDNNQIIGFMRCISDFTYTTFVMAVIVDDNANKEAVSLILIEKAQRLASHGSCTLILDDADEVEFYSKLGFKYVGIGMKKR